MKPIYRYTHTLVCEALIHIRQKERILDSYGKCEPGFKNDIADHLGDVGPSTESKFAASHVYSFSIYSIMASTNKVIMMMSL